MKDDWWCLTHDSPECQLSCSDEYSFHCVNFDVPTFNSLPGHMCELVVREVEEYERRVDANKPYEDAMDADAFRERYMKAVT